MQFKTVLTRTAPLLALALLATAPAAFAANSKSAPKSAAECTESEKAEKRDQKDSQRLRDGLCSTVSALPSLAIEKTAVTESNKGALPRSHSVGLLTYFDAQTPGDTNTLGLEGRGKFNFPDGEIVNGLGYVARVIANEKKRAGGVQMTAKTAFLPKVVSFQGRAQGAHAKDELKMQYDFGPVLDVFQKDIAGLSVSAQITERVHAETPLIEHETTLRARKKGTNVTVQGTLITPLTENSPATAKLYAELAQDFGNDRFQALIGAMTGGKPAAWKNAAQVFTGVRMAM